MRLERIRVRNFRLLRRASIDLALSGATTVFVGPNNSGKTSVMDALKLFTGQGSDVRKRFTIHDISHPRRIHFKKAEQRISQDIGDEERLELLRKLLPRIRMEL